MGRPLQRGAPPPGYRHGISGQALRAGGGGSAIAPPARLPSLARASPARSPQRYPPRGTLRQDRPQRRGLPRGSYLAGETVTVTFTDNGLGEISHRGVLIASHARRRPPHTSPAREQLPRVRHARVQAPRRSVRGSPGRSHGLRELRRHRLLGGTRRPPQAGRGATRWRHRENGAEGMLLRAEPAKHDRSKEHGAFATPTGRPRRPKASQDQDSSGVTELLEPMWNAGRWDLTRRRVHSVWLCLALLSTTWRQTPALRCA